MVRIGFIGCHEISWHCLKKICDLSQKHNDEIVLVFNLNSEEASKHSASVKFDSLQMEYGFDLHYVKNVAEVNNVELLKMAKIDVLFIIGWHRIVPQNVLDIASIRIGIHSSVLPKDRGSSPINWQIIRGENKGGVTLFHLTVGVDSGPIIDTSRFLIDFADNVKDIYTKATIASLDLLEKNWLDIHNKTVNSIPQNEELATFNERRKPQDGLINWQQSSTICYNWIRSLTAPYPGAFTFWKHKKILIWTAKISNFEGSSPGRIIDITNNITVSTNSGCIEILTLQIESEPICDAKLFIKSYGLKIGEIFMNS